MQKLVPYLWYDKNAKEAVDTYIKVFGGDSKILYTQLMHDTPSGDVDAYQFTVLGYEMGAMSAGPFFKKNPSISISVQFTDEAELDRVYAAFKDGGKDLMPLDWYPWGAKYAWVEDRFGLSWQLNFFKDQSQVKQRVSPALLYTQGMAGKAEEATQLYTSVFPDAGIDFIARYEEGESPTDKPGTIKHAEFKIFGQTVMALDSAADHKFVFNEGISLMVRCKDQEEIDRYWAALTADGGAESVCGWLKDRFGVSWQIIPEEMDEMWAKGTPEQQSRITQAFLKMKKFDLAELRRVYEGN